MVFTGALHSVKEGWYTSQYLTIQPTPDIVEDQASAAGETTGEIDAHCWNRTEYGEVDYGRSLRSEAVA